VSEKSTQFLLWLVALITVPVPFYLAQPELAPVLRLAFFTLLFGGVLVVEGGGWLLTLSTGMGVLQTLVWCGVLWLAVRIVRAGLRRAPTSSVRSAATAAVALGLVLASLFPIYDTALSSTRDRSSVLQIFE
jgi:hypothetical protein